METYDIRAVDILEPTQLMIGHDTEHVGAGWFLEKVVVICGMEQELDDPQITRYNFPCNRSIADPGCAVCYCCLKHTLLVNVTTCCHVACCCLSVNIFIKVIFVAHVTKRYLKYH